MPELLQSFGGDVEPAVVLLTKAFAHVLVQAVRGVGQLLLMVVGQGLADRPCRELGAAAAPQPVCRNQEAINLTALASLLLDVRGEASGKCRVRVGSMCRLST